MESSSAASKPRVALTSKAAKGMNIVMDSEQFIHPEPSLK